MRNLHALALVSALAAGLAGCSTPQGYHVMMGVQRQECQKLPDPAERARCTKEADRSYERYKAETEAGKRAQ